MWSFILLLLADGAYRCSLRGNGTRAGPWLFHQRCAPPARLSGIPHLRR